MLFFIIDFVTAILFLNPDWLSHFEFDLFYLSVTAACF
jgi:hypothetical protein